MNTSDLDDLAPVIGYRATRMLAAWFAGRWVYVPAHASIGHPLETLIGHSAFAALVREFAATHFWVPTTHDEDRFRRERQIAEWFSLNWTADRVAGELGISQRRVEQIRVDLVERGLLQYAQGFGTAMAAGRGRARRETAAPEILGTGEVSGEPPPPAAASAVEIAAGAMGLPG